MKTLKLTNLSKQDLFNKEELKNLKGGASETGSGIFGWCSCPCCCCCNGNDVRACNKGTDNQSNCRCDDKKGTSTQKEATLTAL